MYSSRAIASVPLVLFLDLSPYLSISHSLLWLFPPFSLEINLVQHHISPWQNCQLGSADERKQGQKGLNFSHTHATKKEGSSHFSHCLMTAQFFLSPLDRELSRHLEMKEVFLVARVIHWHCDGKELVFVSVCACVCEREGGLRRGNEIDAVFLHSPV